MSDEELPVPNVSVNDFPNICRSCLGHENLKPIFSVIFGDICISGLIEKCTGLQISENDEMPQNICDNCIEDVVKAYIFIDRSHHTYALLKSIRINAEFVEEKIEIQISNDLDENDSVVNEEHKNTKVERIELRLARRKKKILRCRRLKRKVINYECKVCFETFDSKDKYEVHKKALKHNVINLRKLACHICSKMFTNCKLRQHMLSHTKEKPYECNTCQQRFSIRSNLKRHMMRHTGERPHVCEICGKGFIQATTLQKHKTVHMKREQIVSNSYAYKCDHCGRAFKRLGRYNTHLRKHNLKSATEYVNKSPKEEVKEYICNICKRAYKTKTLLKTHQLTHGEKAFLCSNCGKGFVTNAALQSHVRVHTGEKPYTCSICQKSFAHIGSFEAHSLIHSGQKPYECKTCHKSFTQLTHLKYHLRTHTGERPYVCTYCNKSFALKGNLTVHTRIHTGETPYICPVCNKGFYDSSSMKKHHRGHRDITNLLVKEDIVSKDSNEIVLSEECLILANKMND